MKKFQLIFIFILSMYASISIGKNNPYVAEVLPPQINSKAHFLLDSNSATVLSDNNADKVLEPASLTKMMTMYVVDNEVKNGKLSLSDEVTISTKAWKTDGSRMFLEAGSKVAVSELIKGVIIDSGNDASVALAEYVAGSEEAFAQLMNYYAKIIGMNNTHFANATGLPDAEHYTTARDMATLANRIIHEFPETYKIYSEKEFTYNGIKQNNRNRLLWLNNHVDGIKTGQTDNAGYCLVASGITNGTRLIAVVMGTNSDNARTGETNKLLNWGFRFFETKKILSASEPIKSVRVWLGKDSEAALGSANDLYITVPTGKMRKISTKIEALSQLKAPINRGDQIGKFSVLDEEGNVLMEHPLISIQTIPTGSIWKRFKDHISMSTNSLLKKMDT